MQPKFVNNITERNWRINFKCRHIFDKLLLEVDQLRYSEGSEQQTVVMFCMAQCSKRDKKISRNLRFSSNKKNHLEIFTDFEILLVINNN